MQVQFSRGRFVALSFFPALLAACSDGTTAVGAAPRPEHVAVVANSAAFTDTAWNTFVAEVTVRASRIDTIGGPVQRPAVPLTYVLERRRHGDDWDTELRIPRQSWMPTHAATGDASNAHRIAGMMFSAGGATTAEDESGAPIDIQRPNPALRRAPPSTPLSPRFAKILATGNAPRPIRKAPHTKGGAWIQSYVTDRAHGVLQRGRIRGAMGAPLGVKGGVERYERRVGSDTRRVFVDADKGLVRSVELERNGKRIRTTSYSYVEQADGSLVRSGIHTETVPTEGHSGGVVDVQFNGVHLEKRTTP